MRVALLPVLSMFDWDDSCMSSAGVAIVSECLSVFAEACVRVYVKVEALTKWYLGGSWRSWLIAQAGVLYIMTGAVDEIEVSLRG